MHEIAGQVRGGDHTLVANCQVPGADQAVARTEVNHRPALKGPHIVEDVGPLAEVDGTEHGAVVVDGGIGAIGAGDGVPRGLDDAVILQEVVFAVDKFHCSGGLGRAIHRPGLRNGHGNIAVARVTLALSVDAIRAQALNLNSTVNIISTLPPEPLPPALWAKIPWA